MPTADLPPDLLALSDVQTGPTSVLGRRLALLVLPLLGLCLYGLGSSGVVACPESNNPGDEVAYTSGAHGESRFALCRPLGDSDSAALLVQVLGALGVLSCVLWLDPGNGAASAAVWIRRTAQVALVALAITAPVLGWTLMGFGALLGAWLVACAVGLRTPALARPVQDAS